MVIVPASGCRADSSPGVTDPIVLDRADNPAGVMSIGGQSCEDCRSDRRAHAATIPLTMAA